jgi:hypothetical protein
VPGGTYLVSDSLECVVNRLGDGRFRTGNGFFIVGDPDDRPVFKLADRAPGFQDASRPRPVLELLCTIDVGYALGPRQEAGAWMMSNGGVSSIVVDCGRGNPGAIGFRCWGAQAMYAENILVRAHGALAGIQDVIGNAGYMANLEVHGGKYGIWARNGQTGSIAGCTLIDQEEAAIVQEMSSWPLTVVGFRIEQERGPVVRLGAPGRGGAKNLGGHLSLVDGTVSLRQPSLAFENRNDQYGTRGKDLYLREVYVRGADALVHSFGADPIAPAPGAWSHVREYAHASANSGITIDGPTRPGPWVELAAAAPPANLMRRHLFSRAELPTGLDADAVSVTDVKALGKFAAKGDGVADDTEAFRRAIAQHRKVFVPKGTFRVTGNVVLRADTVLFGLTAALSVILADVDHWQTPGIEPLFSTADAADATCLISQLTVYPLLSGKTWNNGWPLLDWKAGRRSVVKNFFPDVARWGGVVPDGPLLRISGQGGGRWYALDGGANIRERVRTRENFLHYLIDGTREPLVVYSQCAIHGAGDTFNVIRDSRNIEFYGVMDEANQAGTGYLRITNSENILITGHGGHLGYPGNGRANYRFEGCRDLTLSVMSANDAGSSDKTGATWRRIQDGTTEIGGEKNVAYYRIGRGLRAAAEDATEVMPLRP